LKILFIVAAALLLSPVAAFAQIPSREDILNNTLAGPVFLDAFWTNRTSAPADGSPLEKTEVGPGEGASVLAVTLVNRGLSDITAVTGRLDLPNSFGGLGADSEAAIATSNEIIPAGDTFVLFFQVNVESTAKVREYQAHLTVSYSRIVETGSLRTAEIDVPFRLTGKVTLDALTQTQQLKPGVLNNIEVEIINRGSADATGVTVILSGLSNTATSSDSSRDSNSSIIGQRVFEIGSISAGSSYKLMSAIFADISTAGTAQNVLLQVSYGDVYGTRKTADLTVGLTVSADTPTSVLNVAPSSDDTKLTAGNIEDLNFTVTNVAKKEVSDIIVSLSSQSDSLSILGDSKWSIQSLGPGESQSLSSKIFASKSLVGLPISFAVNVQYLSDGQVKTDDLNLGAYVEGTIDVKLQQLSVNYVANVPNLVGNLLNEGNTVALFTTVEIVTSDQNASTLRPISSQPQYLGDLTDNSPLPFSIPLRSSGAQRPDGEGAGLQSNSISPGNYPVTLRIVYKDDLRNSHELLITSEVNIQPNRQPGPGQQGNAMGQNLVIFLAVGIAVASGLAVFFIRRRKSKKSVFGKLGNKDDIQFLLDTQDKKEVDAGK
jgi:hypothetical protein